MRLLPPDSDHGWVPYAFLIYVGIFLLGPLMSRASLREWVLTAAAAVVFLPLYFLGFWLRGRRCLAVMAAIAVLGVLFAPINPGAWVFFVYAAFYVGNVGGTRAALSVLGGLLAVVGLETYLFHLPPGFWGPGAVFTLLVGLVNIHYSQKREANRCLRRAQEEIEHLAKVAERERIARDLHDILGHTLSVVVLKSELAARLVENDPARARSEIGDVERTAREALAEVRSAIGGYRSSSLAAELDRARATLRTAGVLPECQWSPPPLWPAQETMLALALREAVTNVVRHARAHTCRLSLSQVDGFCRLEVCDDGRGGAAVEGHGLRGMRERVEALGGLIERDTGNGTRLVIAFPLADSVRSMPG